MATLTEILARKTKKDVTPSSAIGSFAPGGANPNKGTTTGVARVGAGLGGKPTTVVAPEQSTGISKVGYGLEKIRNADAVSKTQANENILAGLGLDTALTPKKKKKTPDTVLSAQTEIVNRLGE